jgi:hypothetical protein
VRSPYWPTSRTDFGGQIGASPNGDRAGDIYRLLGGLVLRRRGEPSRYAGYIASAVILPGGTRNNRIVAPGSEDLVGPEGKAARFFLAGLRPGTVFEAGASLTPAAQVDPVLPAHVHFELRYPDGRTLVDQGVCDDFGTYLGGQHWKMDLPGLYRFRVQGVWEGHRGEMPGLPKEGGFLDVLGKRPARGEGLVLESPDSTAFDPAAPMTIRGRSRAKKVYFSLIMPGAVLAQGELPVRNGWFSYVFDAEALRSRLPIYETGKPANGRVVHLSLFSEEKASDGSSAWDIKRVILRGNHIVQVE